MIFNDIHVAANAPGPLSTLLSASAALASMCDVVIRIQGTWGGRVGDLHELQGSTKAAVSLHLFQN